MLHALGVINEVARLSNFGERQCKDGSTLLDLRNFSRQLHFGMGLQGSRTRARSNSEASPASHGYRTRYSAAPKKNGKAAASTSTSSIFLSIENSANEIGGQVFIPERGHSSWLSGSVYAACRFKTIAFSRASTGKGVATKSEDSSSSCRHKPHRTLYLFGKGRVFRQKFTLP